MPITTMEKYARAVIVSIIKRSVSKIKGAYTIQKMKKYNMLLQTMKMMNVFTIKSLTKRQNRWSMNKMYKMCWWAHGLNSGVECLKT